METGFSLNRRAYEAVRRMVAEADVLGIAVHVLPNGTQVLDCGVHVRGGLEAGRRLAEVCMGGLGTVVLTWQTWGDRAWPAVTVYTDHPAQACLAAQYAGWAVRHGDYFAMGSGPARALIRAEAELYEHLGYQDLADVAVLCLETRSLPTADVADFIAHRAGVPPSRLVLLVAPTASLAGGVQVAARSVETALHKLHVLGFDVRQVLHGTGLCPLPPPAEDDVHAIGRTNDAILYGGRVYLTIQAADDTKLEALVPRLPSSASPAYGRPFYEVLKSFDFDFYRIDPLVFSPAEVWVTNVVSGRTFRAGQVDPAVLKRSFGLQ
ncbi:MAG: methenyltetrahydromethanopterin cyclohydrolase [Acidobacteria bacterium]|nr:methenyltetrahydromethanopterin cyclohydrolase [Acidobacteriota bacterium]MDW7984348.1 methenyltetrahydromethanopterin cyclohydrolase [Acidobacteriota bacterium]